LDYFSKTPRIWGVGRCQVTTKAGLIERHPETFVHVIAKTRADGSGASRKRAREIAHQLRRKTMNRLFHSINKVNVFLAVCLCTLYLPACTLPIPVLCTVPDLIHRINDANATPATLDTLNLSADCTYQLAYAVDYTEGDSGLPAITSPIILNGHGTTISRNPVDPDRFRLFFIAGPGDLTLNDLTLTGGYSFNHDDPDNSMSNSGGAIFNRGKVTINRSRIVMNFANNSGEGGAILNIGTLEVSDSTFDGNEDGINTIMGGAALANWGDATITGSAFTRNGHLADQDAIWTQGSLSMTNSTISDSGWGGIDNEFGDTHLNYVTIAYSHRTGMSGVSGHVYMTNSLLAFNGLSNCSPGLPLFNPSESNIMDTDGTCGGITVTEADLQLAPLGDYGGLTETHALGAGSAAIDRVAPFSEVLTHVDPGCIPIDQRGAHRPAGPGCDLGAYEFNGDEVAPAPMLAPTDTTALATFTPTASATSSSTPTASTTPSSTFPIPLILTPTDTLAPVPVVCAGLSMAECNNNSSQCKWTFPIKYFGPGFCEQKK
jgi:hypothetical protein